MQSTFQFIFGHPDIGAGDAMANMAMAMAGIWKAHQPVIPGHHNQWNTLTSYYITKGMKQGQIKVKMYCTFE